MSDEIKNIPNIPKPTEFTPVSKNLVWLFFGIVIVLSLQVLMARFTDRYYVVPAALTVNPLQEIKVPADAGKVFVLPTPEVSVIYRQLPNESVTPELILKAIEERGDLCTDGSYQKPEIYTLGAFDYYDLTAALEIREEIHPESGEVVSTCNYLTFSYSYQSYDLKVSGVLYEADGMAYRSFELDEESKKRLSNIPYGIGAPAEWFDGLDVPSEGLPVTAKIYSLHTTTPYGKGGAAVTVYGELVQPDDKD